MTEEEMTVRTRRKLPIRESPVNFAAFAGDGTITSNAWGVRVVKTGENAVATFRLVFPAWGIWLDAEKRGEAKAST